MGSYVTQDRIIWRPDVYVEASPGYGNGYVYDGPIPLSYAGSQTTTSYRTGGSESLDDLLFSGGSWAGVNQLIRTRERERGTPWDNGHEFDTVKTYFRSPELPVYESRAIHNGRQYYYEGPLLLSSSLFPPHSTPYADVPYPTDLAAWGTKAIAQCKPGDSAANVAQTLIELKREGLPKLYGASVFKGRGSPSSFGEEFLNSEFGWKPLVSDVVDLAEALASAEWTLSEYVRRSGELIRRSWSTGDIVSVSKQEVTLADRDLRAWPWTSYSANAYTLASDGRPTITYSRTERITRRVKFSGAFTYYAPPGLLEMRGISGATERYEYLYGLRLTPELVWNVLPWSWLADWGVNFGDVISNVSALQHDGTVMRYGYIMSHTIHEVTITAHSVPFSRGENTQDISQTFVTERKTRERATPYGFGLDPATFSGRQWAILAALGLTRGNQSIRLSE